MSQHIKTEKIENIFLIKLFGKIDIIVSEEIENKFNSFISMGERYIIFDLNEVTYFSSSGVRVLLSALYKLEEINGKLCIINLISPVQKILETLGLLDKFNIFDSIEKAIDYIKN